MIEADIKILHVNFAKEFRGGERQTELLVRTLHKLHVQQDVLVRKDSPLIARLSDLSAVSVKVTAKPYARYKALSQDYGFVHAHEAKAAQWAYINKLRTGLPYLITRRVMNPPKRNWFTRSVYTHADHVTCLSTAIRNQLLTTFPGVSLSVIPSMCAHFAVNDGEIVEQTEYGQGKYVIGHTGALTREKGQHILISAIKEIESSDIELLLLGKGREEKALKQLAGDNKNIIFAGFKHDVGAYIRKFDLFVFPSLSEGLGSSLLDVMEAGVPIIASDTGGIPDVIQHERNGLLVPSGSVDGLVQAIVRIRHDKKLADRLANQARQDVKCYYPSVIAKRYVSVYQNFK